MAKPATRSTAPRPVPTSSGGGVFHSVLSAPTSPSIDPLLLRYVDNAVDKAKAEMNAEIAKLGATLTQVEAQRTIDYKTLSDSIDNVSKTLPTTAFIKTSIRNVVLTVAGILIGALALIWAVFDTGAGITGSFADKVLESKEIAKTAVSQNTALNTKLDRLIAAQEKANAPQPQTGAGTGQAGSVHTGTPASP